MGYCSTDDVSGEFKTLTLSTTSAIKLATVERFIDEESAIMNSRLAVRFSTPITGTEALIVMRKICIGLVAQRVKRIMEVQGLDEAKDQAARTGDMIKEANLLMADLVGGKATLTDATLLNSSQGLSDYNSENCVEHQFKMGDTQW